MTVAMGIIVMVSMETFQEMDVYASGNVQNSESIIVASEYPPSPHILPTQNYIKNTDNEGLLVGDEVSSRYTKLIGPGTTYEKYSETSGGSRHVLRIALYPSNSVGNGGLEVTGPLYSNTNYTMEFVGRNHGDVGPMRIGYKRNVVGGESWTRLEGNEYKTQTMKFTTSDNNHDYQINPSEQVTAYVYRLFSEDGNRPLDARILSIKMIPNDPILKSTDKTIKFTLSEVKGMKQNEVLEKYKEKINQEVVDAIVDTNNNNNLVPVFVNDTSNNEVINQPDQNFDTTFDGEKWGKKDSGILHVIIVDDVKAPIINSIKDTDKQITGRNMHSRLTKIVRNNRNESKLLPSTGTKQKYKFTIFGVMLLFILIIFPSYLKRKSK